VAIIEDLMVSWPKEAIEWMEAETRGISRLYEPELGIFFREPRIEPVPSNAIYIPWENMKEDSPMYTKIGRWPYRGDRIMVPDVKDLLSNTGHDLGE